MEIVTAKPCLTFIHMYRNDDPLGTLWSKSVWRLGREGPLLEGSAYLVALV